MRTKKALLAALCAALLVVGSVMGTMAYLTSTDTVTNTFTYGQVHILLDEAKANPDGSLVAGAARVEANEYHLLPGHTYAKDPTVTVLKDSEDSYVRMKVKVENLSALTSVLTDASYYDGDLFLLENLCAWNSDSWTCVGFENDTYEFYYKEKVVKNADGNTVLPALFETITLPGAEFNNDNIKALENVKIVVTAEAVQADGFNTAALAWDTIDNQ